MASFRVHYFRVDLTQGEFGDALEASEEYDQIDDELQLFGAQNYTRLEKLERRGDFWLGDLVRVHMDRTAMRAPRTAPIHPVSLEKDEGIAEQTAFLYDEGLNVLALQSNQRGISPTKFVKFFKANTATGSEMELVPVFNNDADSVFESMQSCHKMNIKIANGHRADIAAESESLQNTLAIADALDAISLDLTVSMSHQWRNKALNRRNLNDMAHEAVDYLMGEDDSAEVERIVINGKTPEDKTKKIDLVEGRMRDSMDLSTDDNRALSYAIRKLGLRELYKERRDTLEAMSSED